MIKINNSYILQTFLVIICMITGSGDVLANWEVKINPFKRKLIPLTNSRLGRIEYDGHGGGFHNSDFEYNNHLHNLVKSNFKNNLIPSDGLYMWIKEDSTFYFPSSLQLTLFRTEEEDSTLYLPTKRLKLHLLDTTIYSNGWIVYSSKTINQYYPNSAKPEKNVKYVTRKHFEYHKDTVNIWSSFQSFSGNEDRPEISLVDSSICWYRNAKLIGSRAKSLPILHYNKDFKETIYQYKYRYTIAGRYSYFKMQNRNNPSEVYKSDKIKYKWQPFQDWSILIYRQRPRKLRKIPVDTLKQPVFRYRYNQDLLETYRYEYKPHVFNTQFIERFYVYLENKTKYILSKEYYEIRGYATTIELRKFENGTMSNSISPIFTLYYKPKLSNEDKEQIEANKTFLTPFLETHIPNHTISKRELNNLYKTDSSRSHSRIIKL